VTGTMTFVTPSRCASGDVASPWAIDRNAVPAGSAWAARRLNKSDPGAAGGSPDPLRRSVPAAVPTA
jgi:hypothetical protein